MHAMRHFILTLSIFLFSNELIAQNFSNKGRDFWVGYGYHVRMKTNQNGALNVQDMVLYFATEGVTNITVTIGPPNSPLWTRTYTSGPTATIITSDLIPKSGVEDARLTDESTLPDEKGIHITADKDIVAYAHIYNSSVSGATILFPTNTLGKEYYSINYKNISNDENSNCWFYVMATDTGTTSVQIIPSANTIYHQAGDTFVVNLQQGEIYNLMGELTTHSSPYLGADLTGSKIKSIASGSGNCKRIAVFSGSGKISITCTTNPSATTSDNYMVQAFPKDAWGKKYLTAPTSDLNFNIFRICVQDPATIVKVNGLPISVPLNNNFYYELSATSSPLKIESNFPITVAQYIASQGSTTCGNPSNTSSFPGDPEVIYLSPVEQNISKVIWNAPYSEGRITKHYYNVIIPNRGTAISSFKLDGTVVSPTFFTVHPQDANFSYLSKKLSASGVHIIESDSGFNAIAYGYGSAESYGYNAGTNIKDLYNFLQPLNPLNLTNTPVACTGSSFYYSVTFPFQITSMKWDFHGNSYQSPNTNVTINAPISDTTYVTSGRQVWRYKLPGLYNVSVANTSPGYPVTLTLGTTSTEGCGNTVERDFNLIVYDPPLAKIGWNHSSCIADSVRFIDSSIYSLGAYSYKWFWDFGDGTIDSVRNPVHLYRTSGPFNVKFLLLSNQGCYSDTARRTILINPMPTANFTTAAGPYCKLKDILFTSTATVPSGNIANWNWDMGDGAIYNNNANPFFHSYDSGTYTIKLKVTSDKGCVSNIANNTIIVRPSPKAGFINPQLCLFDIHAYFTDTSNAYGGTITNWLWNFDDVPSGALNTSTLQNPQHDYNAIGTKNAELIVTTNYGCRDTLYQSFIVNGGTPVAKMKLVNTNVICSNSTVSIKDSSIVVPGSIVKIEIYWDTLNTPSVFDTDNAPYVGKIYNHVYPLFNIPLTKTFRIKYRAYSGANCFNDTYFDVLVNALPSLQFNTLRDTCLYISPFQINQVSEVNGLLGTFLFSGTGVSTNGIINPGLIGPNSALIKCIFTTTAGCIDSLSQSIKIVPPPIAKFGFTNPTCLGSNVTFTDTSSSLVGSLTKWTWDFGDASASYTSSTNTPLPHNYAAWGYYDVKLTVTNSGGCNSLTVLKKIKISPYPISDFRFSDTACLPNATVRFVNTSSIADSTQNTFSYLWTFGDPASLLSDTSRLANPNHTYHNLGSYNVNLTVTSNAGCKKTIAKPISGIYPRPKADFNFDKPSTCVRQGVNLIDLSNPSPGTITAWHWNFGDGGNSSLPNPLHTFTDSGKPIVKLYIINSLGCMSDTAQKVFNVYAYPKISAGPDLPVFDGESVLIQASAQGVNMQYLWTDPLYLNNPSILNPSCSLPDNVKEVIYTLSVTGIGDCVSTDDVRIFLLKKLFISNVFSPNNDGINDTWEIKNLEYYPSARMQIFARNGQLVFESKGYTSPWDGRMGGKPLPMDTYYYILEPGIVLQPIKGYVTIIR